MPQSRKQEEGAHFHMLLLPFLLSGAFRTTRSLIFFFVQRVYRASVIVMLTDPISPGSFFIWNAVPTRLSVVIETFFFHSLSLYNIA